MSREQIETLSNIFKYDINLHNVLLWTIYHSSNNEFCLNKKQIAADLKVSRTTVNNKIEQLVKLGYIKLDRVTDNVKIFKNLFM